MTLTRRDFGKLALSAVPAVLTVPALAQTTTTRRPNSVINGVNVGTITYSYRAMPDRAAEAILRYVVDSGISQIEFMGGPVEAFAGAPPRPAGRGVQPTTEQQAAQREHAARLRAWRTSASMDRFKALRKIFNDAGVTIYAWKQLDPNMTDEEIDTMFGVAEALGNTHVTLELVEDAAQLKRLGAMGEKRKISVAYHTHLQGSLWRSTRHLPLRRPTWQTWISGTTWPPAATRSRF